MKRFSRLACLLVAVVSLGASVPASAGHEREEALQHQGAVVEFLHGKGFVKWDEVEWRQGLWKVENATRADGRRYDLELEANTLEIVYLNLKDRHKLVRLGGDIKR